MAKIIVTGGAGFIGSHLVDKLIESNHRVLIVDNFSTGKRENISPKADCRDLDICDFQRFKPILKGQDFVFHLAAVPRVPISVQDPVGTARVNILGTISVFKGAAECGIKRVVFASSSAVYGEQKELPLRENMTPNPVSPYGLQKLAGEQFAKLFTSLYKVPIVSLRYFNVYGPRIDFNSDYSLVLGKFLKQRAAGRPLTVYGDGKQTRGFCFIDDVVKANILAMESDKLKGGEVINIGSEKSQTINYLADLIGGERQYLPPRPGDAPHTKADISKAKELLGWSPEVSFEQGVKRTQEWFRGLSDL